MEYVLKTNSLSKNYKNFKALNGLTMKVPKGAIYGFVGKNGAGKTTLIRLICGLQEPTAEDNLKEQYRIIGLPSFKDIPKLLHIVGLEKAGNKKARHFSLGMKQRLGIAIALSGNPDFLILDEPVNGLDPQGIIEVRELILKLNRERGITFLISSHILDELSRIATHYGFIDRGRMVKEMTSAELDAACRKCISIQVSDIRVLTRVLDEMGIEYSVISDTTADIFSEINISQLAISLAAQKCNIITLNEREESLESYYINLMGGGK